MNFPSQRKAARSCALALLTVSTLASAQVTFYEREDFRGRSFAASSCVNDVSRYGFNDRISSVRPAPSGR